MPATTSPSLTTGGHSGRACVRCRKELTDAASMEAGIGPICRNLDNAVLARLIPSDVGAARAATNRLDLTAVAPETLPTVMEILTTVGNETPSDDWRVTVKRIEWVLSFYGNQPLRSVFTDVVRALGYVGLAALWDGEAATGKASVTCMDGRLVVMGPRNKSANTAFKAIAGRKFHPASTLTPKAAWSFPAATHEAVFMAVVTHYPNFSGLEESIVAAKAFLASVPVVAPVVAGTVEAPAAVAVPVEKKCSIKSAGVLLKIHSPYNAGFIAALKTTIKWSDRRWNKGEQVWEVTANHEAEVKAMLTTHYGADAL